MTKLTLTEIAKRIDAHLKRFENDSDINRYPDKDRKQRGLRPYYNAGARRASNRVAIMYISYQGWTNLTSDEAERYLARLDDGFAGRHWEALREETP